MTITFDLEGQRFMALNGGPEFNFNHAISFMVDCETQEQVDYYLGAFWKVAKKNNVVG